MSGLNEALQIHGKLSIVKTDKDGNTTTTEVPNLVVATGKTVIAARLAGNTAAVMATMGIGTGTTPASASDTTLGNEVWLNNLSVAGGTPSANTVVYTATFNPNQPTTSQAITEAAVFNSSNVMLCRTVFPVINKQTTDTITISWTVSMI